MAKSRSTGPSRHWNEGGEPSSWLPASNALAADRARYRQRVDILLERDRIPRSEELKKWSQEQTKNSWKYVFSGGEDYELVFTMAADDFAALQKEYPDVTKIGSVRKGEGKVYLSCDGQETILSATGWAHF